MRFNFIGLFYRESIDLFQELADIFSNDNNQILSRELLMKVRCISYAKVIEFISLSWNSCSDFLSCTVPALYLLQEATAKFPDLDSNNKILRRRNLQKRRSWIENVSKSYKEIDRPRYK